MTQQGQVFPLAGQGGDGKRWAFRCRLGGRRVRGGCSAAASPPSRQQPGRLSEHSNSYAVSRGLLESPTLAEHEMVIVARGEIDARPAPPQAPARAERVLGRLRPKGGEVSSRRRARAVDGRGGRSGLGYHEMTELVALFTSSFVQGARKRYDAAHEGPLKTSIEAHRRAGIPDWRIWRSGHDLFHLVECDDFETAMRSLESEPANRHWQAVIGDYVDHFRA